MDESGGSRGQLFFVNESELMYPDGLIDLNYPDGVIQEGGRHPALQQQTLSNQYQKKLKAILDQPDLKSQVA